VRFLLEKHNALITIAMRLLRGLGDAYNLRFHIAPPSHRPFTEPLQMDIEVSASYQFFADQKEILKALKDARNKNRAILKEIEIAERNLAAAEIAHQKLLEKRA